MAKKKYDFSGWATRNGLLCSDGRTIEQDAFANDTGKVVPLVWQHQHNSPENVLGHALLENRSEGVYAYCSFNDTDSAKIAKELVEHGDINSLSIHANKLKQKGGHVLHGVIREVSLVLSGANPGALIDSPVLTHSDGTYETLDDEATIYTGHLLSNYSGEVELEHADEEEDEEKEGKEEVSNDKTVKEVFDSLNEEQKQVVYFLIGKALEGDKGGMSHADEDDKPEEIQNGGGKTVKQVFDTLTEEQKKVVYFMIGKALEDKKNGKAVEEDEEAVEHSYYWEDEDDMKYNVFEGEELMHDALTQDQLSTIIKDAKKCGSLKESFLEHADEYGIENIDYLFPEAKDINSGAPEFIKRPDTWVTKVMGAVHHTPFSRIKSVFADITADEARAKGYLKGHLKKEEVFSLLKRTTTPQTVYKKQRLDRDDQVDIVDFDVVAWLKTEMRAMLNEELARAFMFGDGRLSSDDDKINETNIRPIISDADLYTIKVDVETGETDDATAKNIIRGAIKARKDYRGSGNPTLYVGEEWLSNMLLLEDNLGHAMYKTEAELATKMRVKEIVAVPDEIIPEGFYGVIVNLTDYNVGADKGGAVNMFDDFDIDYNQMKYLIETRCSGALTKPYSAIALRVKTGD